MAIPTHQPVAGVVSPPASTPSGSVLSCPRCGNPLPRLWLPPRCHACRSPLASDPDAGYRNGQRLAGLANCEDAVAAVPDKPACRGCGTDWPAGCIIRPDALSLAAETLPAELCQQADAFAKQAGEVAPESLDGGIA